ncbi:MAG: NAD(+) synthase [Chloroflexi bacterium HGW-Chloroflexi-6]|nr:MAG: NAD(+) synthase [Chloroflexi bacterium HGW-Chloroflexi-6]
MRIAICQANPTIADLAGNVALCLGAARKAAAQAPDLIVFPEMVIPGYPPRDILYDESFVEAVLAASADFAAQCEGLPPVLFGSIARMKAESQKTNRLLPGLLNVAYLAQRGLMTIAAEKRLLPVYDVFYEPRWFVPGAFCPPLEVAGQKVGILICEDLWDEDYELHPAAELKAAGAQLLVCLSASPYRQGVLEKRIEQGRRAVSISSTTASSIPLVFVNLVGANDELIFDGRSFVLDDESCHCKAGFTEAISIVTINKEKKDERPKNEAKQLSGMDDLSQALTLGIRDFARKNGLERAFIGVSGGIDSALALVLAVKALGAENVTGIAIPSRFSDPRSAQSARQLCESLGCGFESVELEPLHLAAEQTLGSLFKQGTGAENAQARLRMLVLMSYVNAFGGFLINTSNKTELALGYSTLYGDMAGALCPLADLTKPQVYELAEFLNEEFRMQNAEYSSKNLHSAFCIPPFILSRPPSAELRPEQVDPFDYDKISPELEAIVQTDGTHPALKRSEHKRWQFGIVLKVSERAFGTGRMVPVTKK